MGDSGTGILLIPLAMLSYPNAVLVKKICLVYGTPNATKWHQNCQKVRTAIGQSERES